MLPEPGSTPECVCVLKLIPAPVTSPETVNVPVIVVSPVIIVFPVSFISPDFNANFVLPSNVEMTTAPASSSDIFMSLILSIMGEIGDLVFSYIKRDFNKKDYAK